MDNGQEISQRPPLMAVAHGKLLRAYSASLVELAGRIQERRLCAHVPGDTSSQISAKTLFA